MHLSRLANAALLLAFLCAAPAHAAGLFSRKGTPLTDIVGSSRPMTVSAPDDRTRAVARFTEGKEDDTLTVYLGARGGFDFPGGPGAELVWAPDSRALAVTYEDDERMRTAFLVRRKTRGWRRVNLADAVAKVYRAPEGCDDGVAPDVVALGWTSGQRLIVAATMPEKADCPVKGQFTAYFVDVPSGEVLMSLDQHTTERRYRAMLGKKLAPVRAHGRHHRRSHHAD